MASFGGVSCDHVKGTANAKTRRLDVFTRPGLDGHGAVDLGDAADPNTFELTYYGTYTNCLAWLRSIEALRGTIVAVVNDWGTETTSWLFLSYSASPIRRADRGTGVAQARAAVRVKGATQ